MTAGYRGVAAKISHHLLKGPDCQIGGTGDSKSHPVHVIGLDHTIWVWPPQSCLSAGCNTTSLYILEMSALTATLCVLNLNMMSCSVGCKVGPTSKMSLREEPLLLLALPSNTSLYLVLLLDSLVTACMGM